jgi:hypothetical protein
MISAKKTMPYMLGAGLLLISAARFCANNDVIGGIIAGIAACLAFLLPFIRR